VNRSGVGVLVEVERDPELLARQSRRQRIVAERHLDRDRPGIVVRDVDAVDIGSELHVAGSVRESAGVGGPCDAGDDERAEDGARRNDQPPTRLSLSVRSLHEDLLVASSGHGPKLRRRVHCSLRGDPSGGSGHALALGAAPDSDRGAGYAAWSAIAPSRTSRRTSSVRERTASLRYTRLKWLSIVFRLRKSPSPPPFLL